MTWIGPLILLGAALVLIELVLIAGVLWLVHRPRRRTEGWAAANQRPMDPAEAKLTAETRTVSTDSGPVQIWDIAGEDPEGPTVLLVHGWADGRIGALAWAPVLTPLMSRVVLFDLHAHGHSPKSHCDWGPRQLGAIRSVLDGLEANRPLILLGLSWGGRLALAAAAARPNRVAAVVVDSTARLAIDGLRQGMRQNGLPAWPAANLALAFCGRLIHGDLAELIADCPVPVLMLHGREDSVAPVEPIEAIEKSQPDLSLKIFHNAGHLEPACVDTDGYRRTLREFIRSL